MVSETASPCPVGKLVFPMVKGDGEASYSQNSQYQAFSAKGPTSYLDEALEKMALPAGEGPVRVADLGCSSGPNTIAAVSRIVDKLKHRLPKETEVQAYFNDVATNDFNNLFQLLSSDSRAKNFFSVGSPGSFYHRLFPQSTMHVINSSFSLHWMSKIPDEILDPNSPAYNRAMASYQHSQTAVAKSYQRQALLDLQGFFQARAAELVSGGLLFLSLNGRETSEPHEIDDNNRSPFPSDLHKIMTDLIAEGRTTQEAYETYNMPVYHRNSDDIREALKCCGSMFTLNTLEVHKVVFSEAFAAVEASARPKQVAGLTKAVFNPHLESHFGANVADLVWQRYEKLMETNLGKRSDQRTQWIVALTRN